MPMLSPISHLQQIHRNKSFCRMYGLAVKLSVATRTDLKNILIRLLFEINQIQKYIVKFQVQIDRGIVVCYWLKQLYIFANFYHTIFPVDCCTCKKYFCFWLQSSMQFILVKEAKMMIDCFINFVLFGKMCKLWIALIEIAHPEIS